MNLSRGAGPEYSPLYQGRSNQILMADETFLPLRTRTAVVSKVNPHHDESAFAIAQTWFSAGLYPVGAQRHDTPWI